MDDPYDLRRYVLAQDPVFLRVCTELAAGHKQSHWMWFIFPQLQGLGSSSTAQRYAIGSLEEARAYLAHPVLGERLRHCTQLVNCVEGRTAQAIFGYPDFLKFRSCMTLFARAAAEGGRPHGRNAKGPGGGGGDATSAAGDEPAARAAAANRVFREALARYFAGEEDPLTRELLG